MSPQNECFQRKTGGLFMARLKAKVNTKWITADNAQQLVNNALALCSNAPIDKNPSVLTQAIISPFIRPREPSPKAHWLGGIFAKSYPARSGRYGLKEHHRRYPEAQNCLPPSPCTPACGADKSAHCVGKLLISHTSAST